MKEPLSNATLEAFITSPTFILTQSEQKALAVEVLKARYILDKQYRTLEVLLEDRNDYRQYRKLAEVSRDFT